MTSKGILWVKYESNWAKGKKNIFLTSQMDRQIDGSHLEPNWAKGKKKYAPNIFFSQMDRLRQIELDHFWVPT